MPSSPSSDNVTANGTRDGPPIPPLVPGGTASPQAEDGTPGLSGLRPANEFKINDDGIGFKASIDCLHVSNLNPRSRDNPDMPDFSKRNVTAAIQKNYKEWCSGPDPRRWIYQPHENSRWLKVILARGDAEDDDSFNAREQKLITAYQDRLKEKAKDPTALALFTDPSDKFEVLAGQHRLGVARLIQLDHPELDIGKVLSLQVYRRAVLDDSDAVQEILWNTNQHDSIRGFSIIDMLHHALVAVVDKDLDISNCPRTGLGAAERYAWARQQRFHTLADKNPSVKATTSNMVKALLAFPSFCQAFRDALTSDSPSAWIVLRGISDAHRDNWRVHRFGQAYVGQLVFRAITMYLSMLGHGTDPDIFDAMQGLPGRADIGADKTNQDRVLWDTVVEQLEKMRVAVENNGEGLKSRRWRYRKEDLEYASQHLDISFDAGFTKEEFETIWFALWNAETVQLFCEWKRELGWFVGISTPRNSKKRTPPVTAKSSSTQSSRPKASKSSKGKKSESNVLDQQPIQQPVFHTLQPLDPVREQLREKQMADPEAWALIPTLGLTHIVFDAHTEVFLDDVLEPIGLHAVDQDTVSNVKVGGGNNSKPWVQRPTGASSWLHPNLLEHEDRLYKQAFPLPASTRTKCKGLGKAAMMHMEAFDEKLPKLSYVAREDSFYEYFIRFAVSRKHNREEILQNAFDAKPAPANASNAETPAKQGKGKSRAADAAAEPEARAWLLSASVRRIGLLLAMSTRTLKLGADDLEAALLAMRSSLIVSGHPGATIDRAISLRRIAQLYDRSITEPRSNSYADLIGWMQSSPIIEELDQDPAPSPESSPPMPELRLQSMSPATRLSSRRGTNATSPGPVAGPSQSSYEVQELTPRQRKPGSSKTYTTQNTRAPPPPPKASSADNNDAKEPSSSAAAESQDEDDGDKSPWSGMSNDEQEEEDEVQEDMVVEAATDGILVESGRANPARSRNGKRSAPESTEEPASKLAKKAAMRANRMGAFARKG